VNPAPETFATTRLTARRVGVDDQPFLVGLFADERVTRTLGGPRDVTRVRDDVDRWNRHWDEHGFGLWTLRLRDDATPVGWTMLHTTATGGPGVEVGWTVAADHWRQGDATRPRPRRSTSGSARSGSTGSSRSRPSTTSRPAA
jgi:RimJ/RimL family protein N-acetyltransferase